jgi:hypothetical protein
MLDWVKRFSLPFLNKSKREVKVEKQAEELVLPEGFVRVNEFSPFPLYRFLVSKETITLLKGYHLVFDQPPPSFFYEGVEFVKYPPCGGKVWLEDDLRGKNVSVSLPKVGEIERVIAERLTKKFLEYMKGVTPVCENELSPYIPPEGRIWLKLKLFKEWNGWQKLNAVREKARAKGKDLNPCGVFSLVITKLESVPLLEGEAELEDKIRQPETGKVSEGQDKV